MHQSDSIAELEPLYRLIHNGSESAPPPVYQAVATLAGGGDKVTAAVAESAVVDQTVTWNVLALTKTRLIAVTVSGDKAHLTSDCKGDIDYEIDASVRPLASIRHLRVADHKWSYMDARSKWHWEIRWEIVLEDGGVLAVPDLASSTFVAFRTKGNEFVEQLLAVVDSHQLPGQVGS